MTGPPRKRRRASRRGAARASRANRDRKKEAEAAVKGPPCLMTCPNELVLQVGENLSSKDLIALASTCRRYRIVFQEVVWDSLVVRPVVSELYHYIPDTMPGSIATRLIEHLHFRASRDAVDASRCIHWDPCIQSTGNSKYKLQPSSFRWPLFETLGAHCAAFVGRIRRDQLKSFSWEMGVCVPEPVLAELASTQSHIKGLSFVTDGRCDRWPAALTKHARRFSNLVHFSWRGPPDLDTLAEFLGPRTKPLRRGRTVQIECALETLDIHWTTPDIYNRSMKHAKNSLGRQPWLHPRHWRNPPGNPLPSFPMPHLRYLCLTKVPLALDLFSHILNLDTVEYLIIRDCSRWIEAMEHAVGKRTTPFALDTLELKSSGDSWININHGDHDRRWLLFLDLIESVDELFLSIEVSSADAIADFWPVFRRLGDTASSHVLHFRENTRNDWFEDAYDIKHMGTVRDDDPQIVHPFSNSSAEALGISCHPDHLKTVMKPFSRTRTLLFLHVRQTSLDLDEVGSWAIRTHLPWNAMGTPYSRILQGPFFRFAEWAFGPLGILSLKALAFGDFGFADKIEGHNHLLVRSEDSKWGFRLVGVQEDEGFSIINENRRLLMACPSTPPIQDAARLDRERNGRGSAYCPTSVLSLAGDTNGGASDSGEADAHNDESDVDEAEQDGDYEESGDAAEDEEDTEIDRQPRAKKRKRKDNSGRRKSTGNKASRGRKRRRGGSQAAARQSGNRN